MPEPGVCSDAACIAPLREPLLQCARCNKVSYCSKLFQTQAWKAGHKKECGEEAGREGNEDGGGQNIIIPLHIKAPCSRPRPGRAEDWLLGTARELCAMMSRHSSCTGRQWTRRKRGNVLDPQSQARAALDLGVTLFTQALFKHFKFAVASDSPRAHTRLPSRLHRKHAPSTCMLRKRAAPCPGLWVQLQTREHLAVSCVSCVGNG